MKKSDLNSIEAFTKKHTEDAKHSMCVAKLSLQIFDDLKCFHKLSKDDRNILEAAALLHDIGWGISGGTHNKTGMKFILEEKKFPFTFREKILVALIVRYHRGTSPKKSHKLFSAQKKSDQYIVRTLAGILRVADGLDSSHCSVVKSVKADVISGRLCLCCFAKTNGVLEKRRCVKKSDMLSDVLGAELKVVWKKK